MSKILCVILHYKTIDKTIDCMESILNQKVPSDSEIYITLICNGSNDGTDETLFERYSEVANVVLSKYNMVFSAAMNFGVRQSKIKPDYVLLINNDITINGDNLFVDMIKSYKTYNWAVMGPDIYSISSCSYDNPIKEKESFNIIKLCLSLLKTDIDIILKKWKKPLQINDQKKKRNIHLVENCVLHGAFLIFSPIYMRVYPNVIFPQKSFYMEEDLIYFLCKKYNLKTMYDPSIKINHHHSVSIMKMFDDNIVKKQKFVLLEHRKSKKTLLKLVFKSYFCDIKF